jgi:hypothetical protein
MFFMRILLEIGVARLPAAFSVRAEIDETRDFAVPSARLKRGRFDGFGTKVDECQ